MKITRYINGEKIKKPLGEITIKNDVVKDIIARVNTRVNPEGKKVVNE